MSCLINHNADDLDWIGVRFLDPVGRVFKLDGVYYRAIYSDSKSFIEELLKNGLLHRLSSQGLIVKSKVCDFEIEGYSLVLEHQTGTHMLTPNRPFETLREAALCWLQLNLEIADDGLGLIDGHMGNFVLLGKSKPTWCDIGSIQPLKKVNQGITEFTKIFINPIQLMAHDSELRRIGRVLCGGGGLNDAELSALGVGENGYIRRLKRITQNVQHRISGFMALGVETFSEGGISCDGRMITARKNLLSSLKQDVEKCRELIVGTTWSKYTTADHLRKVGGFSTKIGEPETVSNRLPYFNRFLKKMAPETVLDLGSNAGTFALSAAEFGCNVVAVDADDDALNTLVRYLRTVEDKWNIDVVLRDVLYLDKTFQADFVSAMALTHHLAITQNFPFSFIAERLAKLSNYALVTEFMPLGLGIKKQPVPSPLPEGYSLENITSSFRNYFQNVEVLDYPIPPSYSKRVMIQCWERC